MFSSKLLYKYIKLPDDIVHRIYNVYKTSFNNKKQNCCIMCQAEIKHPYLYVDGISGVCFICAYGL